MSSNIGGNLLMDAFDDGRAALGLWCSIGSSVSAEGGAAQGFDYVCVDQQHGALDYHDAVPMFQAIDPWSTPISRVSWNDPGLIMKALDAGAKGVVVPLVSTAADAEAAVRACRYPPRGIRSFGPVRASVALGTRDPAELDRVACIVMIETLEGLDNLDAIASVPGLDAIYVGPSDLALAMGLPPGYDLPDPRHAEAIQAIRKACERHGIVPGIACVDGETGARRLDQGFRMVTVANDLGLIRKGGAEALAIASRSRGGS